MEYRKALRKRKHLEEEEEDPSREQEELSSSSSPPSEASDTSDQDYKPGPGEETTGSGPEESPRPRAAASSSSTTSSSTTSSTTSSSTAVGSSTAASSSSTASSSTASSTAASSSTTASSSTASSSTASSSTAPRTPSRCTVYRRNKRAAKDRAVLAQAAESGPQGTPGGPCDICGHPRRLDGGHAFYQGQFFCSMEDGPGGRTPQQWLAERRGPADISIPRTTLWRMRKEFEKEEEEEEAVSSTSQGRKRRKRNKLRTCQRCGQPAQKDFGHSQLNRPGCKKEYFCALYEGKSLELWLAERRAQR